MAPDSFDAWVRDVFGADPASYADAGGAGDDGPGHGAPGPARGRVPVGPGKVPEMDALWAKSVKDGDWQTAAEVVNGFNAPDLKARLSKLSADQIAKVHKGAVDNPRVGQNSAVALATTAMVHPVVGPAQADRAKAIEDGLKPEDKKKYHEILDAAKSEKEKQYITKGLAAGHTVADLKKFADKISGKDAKWLQDNLSLTGNSSGKGVKQQWSMSCNATAQEAVRGEMDPVYALKMHEDDPKLTEAYESDPTKTTAENMKDAAALNPTLAADQKALLQKANPDGSKGGDAVPRGSGIKAGGRWNTDLLNSATDETGISYSNKKLGKGYSVGDSLKDVNGGLSRGMPVPIVIGDGGKNTYAHYVLITATDPGPPRYYTIHDPGSGDTVVVSEDQIKKGNINVSGWTKLSAIEAPTEVKKK